MKGNVPTLQLDPKVSQDVNASEQSLIAKAKAGDEQAFGELYDIWADKVYRFVYTKVKATAPAEDLTSEIFLRAWQKLYQYQPRSDAKFSSWLYSIARNAVIDYYRIARHQEVSFEDLPEIADLEGDTPYAEVGELEAALSKLPEEYEHVLRLRFIEQVPIARVAQILKKKEDNIRAITSRALKRLKEVLGYN